MQSKGGLARGNQRDETSSILYHRKLNVGRVVSLTLALIVQRECEIDAFKPEKFLHSGA